MRCLQLLPELLPLYNAHPEHGSDVPRRYDARYSDIDRGLLVKFLGRLWQNESGIRVLYLLGHRFHRFNAAAEIRNGKVVRVQYDLWVDTGENHMMYQGVGISVTGFSRTGWTKPGGTIATTYDDLKPYAERVASNAPENYLALAFTPEAASDFVRAALDVRLSCLWSLSPCKNAKQLLPGVWPPRFSWNALPFGKGPLPPP